MCDHLWLTRRVQPHLNLHVHSVVDELFLMYELMMAKAREATGIIQDKNLMATEFKSLTASHTGSSFCL
jgi:hypothetical protein